MYFLFYRNRERVIRFTSSFEFSGSVVVQWPIRARQNQFFHGKVNFSTAKLISPRQKLISSRQKLISPRQKFCPRQKLISSRQKSISPRQNLIFSRQNLISPRQNLIPSRQNLVPSRHGLRACARSDSLCPGSKGTLQRKPKIVTRCRFHVVAVIQGSIFKLSTPLST